MKKNLVIPLILFSYGFVNAQSYIYHPMPESNAVWRVNYSDWFCYPLYSAYQYTILGDTIIGANLYNKIYVSGIENICNGQSWMEYYRGGMRNDTINRKVYFVERDSINEKLLYDFSLTVGDSILISDNVPPDYDIITSIDSVLVGSKFHKRWTGSFSYIEGVGSYNGLLEFFNHWWESAVELVCFSHNGEIYPELTTACPLISIGMLAIKEQNFESNKIIISPNPIISISNLSLNDKEDTMKEIEIYDSMGSKIEHFENKDEKTIEINKNGLAGGIYIIKILTMKDRTYTTKFFTF